MAVYISNPSKTAEILKDNNIKLRKNLGQNFLVDTNILKKIVRLSSISDDEAVLEIGSGIGSLTQLLLHAAGKIVCLEIDKRLISVFEGLFSEYIGKKIILIQTDAMKWDYLKFMAKYNTGKVVSNLPYKIAAPLILKILADVPQIKSMYLTIQKDIADRICAKKGDKNYSSYSVKANYLADFKVLFNIQRNCFMPVPFIDSTFIEVLRKDADESLDKYSEGKSPSDKYHAGLAPQLQKEFFDFIDACFLHRRKKLINSLLGSLYIERSSLFQGISRIDKIDLMAKMLCGIGKDKNIRAEELEIKDFINLFVSLKNTI